MTQQKGLKHGLYTIYWTTGGKSLSAIGYTHDGTNWFACCNWTTADNKSPMVASTDWSEVERIELIKEHSYDPDESIPEDSGEDEIVEISEELWDKHSEHIDDNISSLERVAGTSILNKWDYNKLIQELKSQYIIKRKQ